MSHSRQTEHYDLPLYNGTDIINPLTDFNNANEAIDTAVYNANQRSVQAETTANEAKDIAEGYDSRVTQAIQTANDAMTLANNTQDMIADDFDPMKQGGYQVGDFVIYNGVLYRFINAHTGAWDASDVQVSPVLIDAIADVVDEGKQAIEEAVEEAEEEIAGQTEKVTKTQAMIAQPFDENKVGGYAVDDVVTYADKLYKFTSAHSGAWTGLDVEQVVVEEEIAGQTEKVTKTQAMIAQPFDANKSGGYAVGDIVTYADKLYKFTSQHSGAWTGLDVEQVDVIGLMPNVIRIDLDNTATWKTTLTNIVNALNSIGITDFTSIKDCKLIISTNAISGFARTVVYRCVESIKGYEDHNILLKNIKPNINSSGTSCVLELTQITLEQTTEYISVKTGAISAGANSTTWGSYAVKTNDIIISNGSGYAEFMWE